MGKVSIRIKDNLDKKIASLKDAKEWNEVMNYFKSNPKALLDAIPTPRGEEEKALKELKNGFL